MALLVGEIVTRIFVPRYIWEFVTADDYWQPDSTLGWVQKSNFDTTILGESNQPVRFRTNPDGVFPYTAEPRRNPARKRVMIFGDSTVVGRLVPQNLSITGQLERSLTAQGVQAEVICAGVEGYGADQSLLRMKQLVPKYHPDLILFGSCENDFSENDEGHSHDFPKPHFVLSHDGRLELVPLSGFPAQAQDDSGWRVLLRHSALYRFLYPEIAVLTARFEGKPEQFSNTVEMQNLDSKLVDNYNWTLAAAIWREMARVAESNQSQFLFYSHPSYYEVWDNSELPSSLGRHALENHYAAVLEKENIQFCRLVDYFRKNRARGPFHLPMNPHCNSRGFELTAEVLAEEIRKKKLLE